MGDTYDKVRGILAECLNFNAKNMTYGSILMVDLGADSLDIVEMVVTV